MRCCQYSANLGNWHPTRLIDLGANWSSYWKPYSTAHDGPLFSGHSETIDCSLWRSNYMLFGEELLERNIFAGPLHKRGWVFQERYLSPRVWYFGNSQVLWECSQETKCESFPKLFRYSPDKDLSNQWDLLDLQALLPMNGPEDKCIMSLPVYSLWRDLVKCYSQCALTKTEDKLPAFTGIAKLFQEATGDDCLAGLWRSRILEGCRL